MKTLNKSIFLSYPIALMAAVVRMDLKKQNNDYSNEAIRVVDYFNNLENDSPAIVNSFTCQAFFSGKELQMILKYVRIQFGRITSFVSTKIGNGHTIYKMNCAVGKFKMTLQTSSDNRITSLELVKYGEN